MKNRRYSDDERASALAALAANGGSISRTARQLGIPSRTLRQWASGERHPEAAQASIRKKDEFASELEKLAWRLVEALPEKIPDASLAQVATAMGIAIDKARLLRNEATVVTEFHDMRRIEELRCRYGELRENEPGEHDSVTRGDGNAKANHA